MDGPLLFSTIMTTNLWHEPGPFCLTLFHVPPVAFHVAEQLTLEDVDGDHDDDDAGDDDDEPGPCQPCRQLLLHL